MKTIPFCGYRCWSIIQVLAVIVVCNRSNASGERAEGCVRSRLSLSCPDMKVIEVTDVVLGDSKCYWRTCCIKDQDCTDYANANHVADVHRRCDGKSSCTVDVIKEGIDCGALGKWSDNDFERITYNCIDDPRKRAQGCVGYRLSLSCPELKVIEVSDVVLGNSKCYWGSCCINDQACTENANANHVMDVQHRCNGQSNCTVDVIEEVITCGYFGFGTYNDFESITYTCGADSQRTSGKGDTQTIWNTRENSPDIEGTHGPKAQNLDTTSNDTYDFESADYSDEEQHTTKAANSTIPGTFIVCFVCLIVVTAIVASVSIFMVRRKKKRHVRRSDAVRTSYTEIDRIDAFAMNEAQRTSQCENAGSTFSIRSNDYYAGITASLNSGAKNFEIPSDYCELEEVYSCNSTSL